MNELTMPALDGRSPLGILAAIGVVQLLDAHTDDTPALAWSRNDLTATLRTTRNDLDQVVSDLAGIAEAVAHGAALPAVPAGFPPPGAAPDGLRVLLDDFRGFVRALDGPGWDEDASAHAERWLGSLVTDLGADERGRVAISQFAAPSGKQSMSTMLAKPLEIVRAEPDVLRQALLGWRRYPGVTGEYLDHRAMRDAAEAGDGGAGPMMRGVPGATWLALMSYPLFRTTWSPRGRPATSGWHSIGLPGSRRRVDTLCLPVWSQYAGPSGIVALIEHPLLVEVAETRLAGARRVEGTKTGRPDPLRGRMDALGLVDVCLAQRRKPTGSKSAGVLTPVGR